MIPRNKITSRRKIAAMKIHLNLRQTMNFMVLQGFINQKNEVSGRLWNRERQQHSHNSREAIHRDTKSYF